MKMTSEILDVIVAVYDYKKHIVSHNRVCPKPDFDWFSETEKYYCGLPLPFEMKRNRDDFERVLGFVSNRDMIERMCNMEEWALSQYFWK